MKPADKAAPESSIGTVVVPTRAAPVTFVFYFDQAFLTMVGRIQAMDLARELIPKLVVEGNRAMVLSSGRKLETFADLTTDNEVLIKAVTAVEKDVTDQWDPTMMSEETRIQEVLDAMKDPRDGSTDRALGIARRYQAEERWRSEKALRRFSMALGRLAELPPPKAVVYFADRLRQRPGEHFLNFFGSYTIENTAEGRSMDLDAFAGMNAFDRVIDEANAHGVRLYTIQAEGLFNLGMLSSSTRGNPAATTRGHINAAKDSLVGLAIETGGQAFLHGIKGAKIARRIQSDMGCVYLISFDAQGLPQDRGLPVRLRTRRDKVQVQVRGQILIQSESARTTSRLLAAFTAPNAMRTDIHVRGQVIPTGFDKGTYTALVQLWVAGSPESGSSWDLGASLVSKDKVREDASARIEVAVPGTSVVLETEMTFRPGPYELVLVAHETGADQIATGQIEGSWPDPNDGPAAVGPIAVMQPTTAAFMRNGEFRRRGSLAHGKTELLRTDLPTALVSIVCRGRGQKGKLRVERLLAGDTAVSFKDVHLGDERCAQIRDVISAGTMTDGMFEYKIRVLRKGELIADGERSFAVAGDDPLPEAETEVGGSEL